MTTVQHAHEVSDASGADLDDLVAAFRRLGEALKQADVTPQAELKFRLQCNIDGEDPGHPYNTGADGWRVR